MFICQRCKNVSFPNEKQNRVIVETRYKIYYEMSTDYDQEGNLIKIQGQQQGTGKETVREISVCNRCV